MPKRYRVANPHPAGDGMEHTYPADAQSLSVIKAAGGLSQISDEVRSQLKFKTVRPGDDCSDMPDSTKEIFLERGWIEEVQTAPAKVVAPVEEDQ